MDLLGLCCNFGIITNQITMTNLHEIWKDIPLFNGRYQVSNTGLIRSATWVDAAGHIRRGKILKQNMDSSGYVQITLVYENKTKLFLLHRLIAKTFLPLIQGKDFVNHINGIKHDNRVDNLEWCTKRENSVHSFAIGLQCNKGDNHPANKLTTKDVIKIREIRSLTNIPYKKLGLLFGISKTQTRDICILKSWRHIC